MPQPSMIVLRALKLSLSSESCNAIINRAIYRLVYAFVDTTPISDPALMCTLQWVSREMLDSTVFTTPRRAQREDGVRHFAQLGDEHADVVPEYRRVTVEEIRGEFHGYRGFGELFEDHVGGDGAVVGRAAGAEHDASPALDRGKVGFEALRPLRLTRPRMVLMTESGCS
ncbi:hypothetical protein M422DRAFT_246143 [Sphaerobolus stellatus SS14]|nr:hypothetical protein M422DRAFT_246143 [Sphaerobolus stellatus SS14]